MPQVQITIVGNLAADPELRFTAKGNAVANFRVAVQDSVKTADGWSDGVTAWYSVTAWKKLAENIAETLTKGTKVVVVGRLTMENYETKEGEQRSAFKITASGVGPDLSHASAVVTRNTKSDDTEPAGGK